MAPKSMKSRRRKNQFKDFQKVKLKAGKTLPKGQNVTNASFKSRQLLIREQLPQSNISEPQTCRKLNITTLLSQIEHYNMTIRRDAVIGLHQLVQANPGILQHHLATILERSTSLFVDKESSVRQGSLKLCKVLTDHVTADQIAPFFKLILAHLCCAMTHIEEIIQLHSMSLVDLFLDSYPTLMIKHISELLPNFVSLIARRSQPLGKGTATLAINPSQKIHAQKWRTNVLERLHAVLVAVVNHERDNDRHVAGTAANEKAFVAIDESRPLHHRPMNGLGFDVDFRFRCQQMGGGGDLFSSPQHLETFVSQLVTLLLESWVECTSCQAENGPIGEDVVKNMTSILKVLQLLWRCVAKRSAVTMATYTGRFVTHFMDMFPYSDHDTAVRHKKNKKVKIEKVSMVELNLRICDLMSYTIASHDSDWLEKLLDYISRLHGRSLQHDDIKLLFVVLEQLLSRRNPRADDVVVLCLVTMYRRGQIPVAERVRLHKFMLNHVVPHARLVSQTPVQEWMSTLPSQLMAATGHVSRQESAVTELLHVMARLTAQAHPSMLEALSAHLHTILESDFLNKVGITDQRRFFEMIYHLHHVTLNQLKLLLSWCRLPTADPGNVKYLVDILHHRMLRDDGYCSVGDFLSFLLSLCIVTPASFTRSNETACLSQEWCERQGTLLKIVADRLLTFQNREQIIQVLQHFISKTGEDKTRMDSASFMFLFTKLVQKDVVFDLYLVSELAISALLLEDEEEQDFVELCRAGVIELLSYPGLLAKCVDVLERKAAENSDASSDWLYFANAVFRLVKPTVMKPIVKVYGQRLCAMLNKLSDVS